MVQLRAKQRPRRACRSELSLQTCHRRLLNLDQRARRVRSRRQVYDEASSTTPLCRLSLLNKTSWLAINLIFFIITDDQVSTSLLLSNTDNINGSINISGTQNRTHGHVYLGRDSTSTNGPSLTRARQSEPSYELKSGLHKRSNQLTGCDLLFAPLEVETNGVSGASGGSGSVGQYCRCRDSLGAEDVQDQDDHHLANSAPGSSTQAHPDEAQRVPAPTISQLDCRHDSSAQVLGDLHRLLVSSSPLPPSETPPYRIEYLNIQANLSTSLSGGKQTASPQSLLHVDQLSLTLTNIGNESDEQQRSSSIQDQLRGFIELLEPEQLQSVTISLEYAGANDQRAQGHSPGQEDSRNNVIELDTILSKLGALNRLEISSSLPNQLTKLTSAHYKPPGESQQQMHLLPATLVFGPGAFRQQTRLKWLNLATNYKIEFRSDTSSSSSSGALGSSPFNPLTNLEYLNLESSNLRHFHIFSLFTTKLTTNSSQHQQLFGHPSLASLNLARNGLVSLGADLFCCPSSANGGQGRLIMLPSLNQLDLSYNRLTGIGLDEARTLARVMPQLAYLYLQHNNIIQLNLNALLSIDAKEMAWLERNSYLAKQTSKSFQGAPIGDSDNDNWPASPPMDDAASGSGDQEDNISRLEFIDLSYNNLISLTAFQYGEPNRIGIDNTNNNRHKLRIKSINLSHNHLKRPVSLINAKFINRVVFKETFDIAQEPKLEQQQELFQSHWASLDEHFLLANYSIKHLSSICDYLSPVGQTINSTSDTSDMDESLQELLLDFNRLGSIDAQYFSSDSCGQLESLKLNYNQISHIESNSFNLLHRLKYLHLSDNYLVQLNDSQLFKHNNQLKLLNLARNKLQVLGKQLFSRLNELEELYLNDNELGDESISGDMLVDNHQLMTLDLSNNKLTRLDGATKLFSNLKQLKQLLLHGNNLRQFANSFLELVPEKHPHSLLKQQTSSLLSVILPEKRLTTIVRQQQRQQTGQVTNKKRKGQEGRQRNQKLRDKKSAKHRRQAVTTTTKATSSSDPMSLSTDSIIDEQVDELQPQMAPTSPDDTFEPSSWQVLGLSSNQLNSFQLNSCDNDTEEGRFNFLSTITVLLLNDNQLRELTVKTFGKCLTSSLQVLDLHSNQLKSIDQLALQHLTSLKYLNLANNSLIRLHSGTFAAFHFSLIKLDLSDNQLTDDHHLVDLFAMTTNDRSAIKSTRTHETPASNGSVSSSHKVPPMTRLKLVNLSDNLHLKLDTNDLIQFLNHFGRSLKQVRLNRINSIWSNQQLYNRSSRTGAPPPDKLQLDQLSLTSINNPLDAQFIKYLSANGDYISPSNLSLSQVQRVGSGQSDLISLVAQKFLQNELVELSLASGQLRNAHIESILEQLIANNESSPSLQLLRLDLNSNLLDRWPLGSAAVANKLSNLIEFNLARNKLSGQLFDSKHYKQVDNLKLGQLEALDLSSNSLIGLIDPGSSDQFQLKRLMPSLKRLDLSDNKLHWLPEQLFAGLNELKLIKLSHNRLETIQSLYKLYGQSRAGLLLDVGHNLNLKLDQAHRPSSESQDLPPATFAGGDQFVWEDHSALILHKTSLAGLDCESIDEFTVRHRSHMGAPIAESKSHASGFGLRPKFEKMVSHNDDSGENWLNIIQQQQQQQIQMTLNDNNQELDYLQQVGASCQLLLSSIDELNFESSLSSQPLDSIDSIMDSLVLSLQHNYNPHERLIQVNLSKNRIRSSQAIKQSGQSRTLMANEMKQKKKKKGGRLSASPVVYLDLTQNELSSLPEDFCLQYELVNLRSLTVARNQLTSFNVLLMNLCSQLSYLDLSQNKINSIVYMVPSGLENHHSSRNNLLVLKLNNNQLTQLGTDLIWQFPRLRHLELQSNHFSQYHAQDYLAAMSNLGHVSPLDNLIIFDPISANNHWKDLSMHKNEPIRLAIDAKSIRIQSLGNTSLTLNMSTKNMINTNQVLTAKSNYNTNQTQIIVNFCTLNRKLLHKICLNSTNQANRVGPNYGSNGCFLLRPPADGPTCMTNLEDTSSAPSTLSKRENGINQKQSNESGMIKQVGFIENQQQQQQEQSSSNRHDDDPVLALINQLKYTWLGLKQFDLVNYMASISQIRPDSIWLNVNGTYPIYTLSLIKFGLILAAICIVLLSIAMFALLTSTISTKRRVGDSTGGHRRDEVAFHEKRNELSSSPQPPTIATTLTTNDGSTSVSTYDTTEPAMMSDSTGQSVGTRSSEASEKLNRSRFASIVSSDSSNGGSDSQVRESGAIKAIKSMEQKQQQQQHQQQLLSANQLILTHNKHAMFNADNNQITCSSASPSIGTVETMQAVDSLQSSDIHSATTINSISCQQTPTNQYCEYLVEHQLPPQPPVATVMRMVKSSSANTFNRGHLVGCHRAREVPQVSICTTGQYKYGTLSTVDNNYPKPPPGYLHYQSTRQEHQHQQHQEQYQQQIYIPQSMSFMSAASLSHDHHNTNQYGHSHHHLQQQEQQQHQIQLLLESGDDDADLDPATLSLLSLNTQCENLKI